MAGSNRKNPADPFPPADTISGELYRRDVKSTETEIQPLSEQEVGDQGHRRECVVQKTKASRIPARLSLLQAAGAVIALEPYFMRVASQVRS
jgi:hypothetical protein